MSESERRTSLFLAPLAALLALAACSGDEARKDLPPIEPAGSAPHLVDAAWFDAHVDEVVLVDMQSREDYEKGHLPGARHVTVDELRDRGIKDLLPTASLTARLGALGIDENTHVVVYDNTRGRNASWLWFALDKLGHGEISLLDEPLSRFEGRLVKGPPPKVEAKRYRARTEPSDIIDAEGVRARMGEALILDARPHVQYTAERPKKKMRGGHVEGAYSVPYTTFHGKNGKYLDEQEARAVIERIVGRPVEKDEEIVLYCNSYHEASNVHFHLDRLGFSNILAYDGSMKDWEQRGLPTKKGEQP